MELEQLIENASNVFDKRRSGGSVEEYAMFVFEIRTRIENDMNILSYVHPKENVESWWIEHKKRFYNQEKLNLNNQYTTFYESIRTLAKENENMTGEDLNIFFENTKTTL